MIYFMSYYYFDVYFHRLNKLHNDCFCSLNSHFENLFDCRHQRPTKESLNRPEGTLNEKGDRRSQRRMESKTYRPLSLGGVGDPRRADSEYLAWLLINEGRAFILYSAA
jgi:hypothetical protein